MIFLNCGKITRYRFYHILFTVDINATKKPFSWSWCRRSLLTFRGSASQAAILTNGSRPLTLNMRHGFGFDSSSLTDPWDNPSTASPNNFCPRLWNCRTSLICVVISRVSISLPLADGSSDVPVWGATDASGPSPGATPGPYALLYRCCKSTNMVGWKKAAAAAGANGKNGGIIAMVGCRDGTGCCDSDGGGRIVSSRQTGTVRDGGPSGALLSRNVCSTLWFVRVSGRLHSTCGVAGRDDLTVSPETDAAGVGDGGDG